MADTQTAMLIRGLALEKLRADRAESRVRALEDELIRYKSMQAAPPVAMSTPTEPEQTDEELDAELRSYGIDPKELHQKMRDKLVEVAKGGCQTPLFLEMCRQFGVPTKEPVVGEARTAAYARDEAYFREQCRRSGIDIGAPPVADVPSGDTVLPELPWERMAEIAADDLCSEDCGLQSGCSACVAIKGTRWALQMREELTSYKAKYEETQLPWLPQPDSEGWWWHKFGDEARVRRVTGLMGHGPTRKLFVPSLGNSANSCGGEWQKVVQPSEIKKEEA